MDKAEYIKAILNEISDTKTRLSVEREISAHIDDRISFYSDAGYDETEATKRAMQRMGEPEDVGKKLNLIHNNSAIKSILQFMTLPFIQLLLFVLSQAVIIIMQPAGDELLPILEICVIFLLGGYLYSRISSKEIRVSSVITTAGLIWIVSFFCVAYELIISDEFMFFQVLLSPLSAYIAYFILPDKGVWTDAFSALISPISIFATVLSAKIFNSDKKELKLIAAILFAIAFIASTVICIINYNQSLSKYFV